VIGQVLGHCRIVSKIGEGGMGVVYRAYDEVLHRDVALKVVKKDGRLDTSSSQSLLHEARAFFLSLIRTFAQFTKLARVRASSIL
jgi:eukaryotic-like serine/threonine-protein kinase